MGNSIFTKTQYPIQILIYKNQFDIQVLVNIASYFPDGTKKIRSINIYKDELPILLSMLNNVKDILGE